MKQNKNANFGGYEIMKFIKGVIDEMKIVTWPTKKKLGKDVVTVIQTTLMYAVYFGIVDFALTQVLQLFIK